MTDVANLMKIFHVSSMRGFICVLALILINKHVLYKKFLNLIWI